jgi:hypothetical protein
MCAEYVRRRAERERESDGRVEQNEPHADAATYSDLKCFGDGNVFGSSAAARLAMIVVLLSLVWIWLVCVRM